MLLSFLLALCFALGAFCAGATNAKAVQRFISDTKKSVTIDRKNPPYYDERVITEATCPFYLLSCTHTNFRFRHYLVNTTDVDIGYVAHQDELWDNMGTTQTTVISSRSTALLKSKTTGWTIGGKVSLAVPDIGGGMEMSSSYQETLMTSFTETLTTQITVPCDAGNECGIETWTFFATVKGLCIQTPIVECSQSMDICASDGKFGCSQWKKFYKRNCRNRSLKPCEVTFPLIDHTGKPIRRFVSTAKKLSDFKKKKRI
ncbi:hypothetical protein DCS_05924 [Drechmeria coniospora]|uniref:Lipocalin n=1 Tax=Drechmeria coniospora TaxID=98403 RepID=A0A151GA70_DRECN|nr:hypothetical protein DCS_05924 [Drechmeria coniospora]KYK53975.1 hypothetical protein DCS_05924 [Drechmeria coniospora]